MQIRFVRTLLFALVVLCMSAASFAQIGVGIVVNFAPPPLPVYEQPLCPEDGYIWTPGYWGYGDDFDDYYWVPGTWVLAPEVGFLWTPAYWGWGGEGFVFYGGYWGPVVGFYGGINYGFGYFGEGYEGGRWDNDRFFYNRSVNNVNETVVHNVYNTTVINNNETHVSYNGGDGGIKARPTPQQEAAAHEKHIPPVAVQTQHAQAARTNPQQRASVNMGKPPVAATPKPGALNDRAVVPAKAPGAPYTPPANRAANRGGTQPRNNAAAPASPAPRPENSAPRPDNNASRPTTPVHPHDLPPAARPSAPNTGEPKVDQKYQQQQEKIFAQQEQERQKLQQKQDQEHQRLTQQNASEAAKQQVEQKHQQQTQQLQQRHEQQQQQLQQKQQPQQRQEPPNRDRSKPPN